MEHDTTTRTTGTPVPLWEQTHLAATPTSEPVTSHYTQRPAICCLHLWILVFGLIAVCSSAQASMESSAITTGLSIRNSRAYITGTTIDLYLWSDKLVHLRSSLYDVANWQSDTIIQAYSLSECALNPDAIVGAIEIIPAYTDSSVFAIFAGRDCSIDGGRAELVTVRSNNGIIHHTRGGPCMTTPWIHYGMAVSGRDSSQLFFANASDTSIYKSSDSAKTFRHWARAPYKQPWIDDCFNGYFSGTLEASPFDTNIVFISGADIELQREALYRTTDNGITWDSVFAFDVQPSTFSSAVSRRLYFHPTNPLLLYLRLDSALYHSSDGGSTWQAVLHGKAIHSFCIAHADSDTYPLLVGGDAGEIITSHDGMNWMYYYTLPTSHPVTGLLSYFYGFYTIAITADAAYEIRMSLATPQSKANKSFALYPNPFSNEIIIRTPECAAPHTLAIADMYGNTVRSFGLLQPGNPIPWNGTNNAGLEVATGMYICVFSSSTGSFRIPIIKQ